MEQLVPLLIFLAAAGLFNLLARRARQAAQRREAPAPVPVVPRRTEAPAAPARQRATSQPPAPPDLGRATGAPTGRPRRPRLRLEAAQARPAIVLMAALGPCKGLGSQVSPDAPLALRATPPGTRT
jgi:hypothetical protein